MEFLLTAALAIFFGLIGLLIASRKGRLLIGFVLGFFLGIMGLIFAAYMQPSERKYFDINRTGISNMIIGCGMLIVFGYLSYFMFHRYLETGFITNFLTLVSSFQFAISGFYLLFSGLDKYRTLIKDNG